MSSSDRAAWLGVAVSAALHLGMAAVLVRLPAPAVTSRDLAEGMVEVAVIGPPREGASPAEPTGTAESSPPAPLEPGGRRSAQNVDARDPGQRGDLTGARAVILLFHESDAVTLQDSPLNALSARQTQRIRTAPDRATRDARRATPNPADQPFLASGDGVHPERRPVSAIDPIHGARSAPEPMRRGSDSVDPTDRRTTLGGTDRGEPLLPPLRPPSEHATGALRDSPGTGIAHGRGDRAREAARVAHGRPPVDRGPAATPAESVDPRIRDDEDAELLAAHLVQSMVEATERRGPREGPGRGGVGGGGTPGSGGGRDEGGRASAYGPGAGDHSSLDTSDGRYVRWLLEQRRRVTDRVDFPRARMLAMDQGTTVCRLRVRRDGSLVRPPEMVRSSGHGDLDHAALAAIRAAAPFSPLPAGLVPDVQVLEVTMPVRFHNPMVGN